MPITQTEQGIKEKYDKLHLVLTCCYYQPKGKCLHYPHPTEEEINELEAWAGQEIAEVRSPVETSIGLQQFNQIHGNIHSEMDSLLIAAGFLEPPPTPGPYIDTDEIVPHAVTEGKIPPDALTHLAVGPGAIRESELATGAVTEPKIADDAVTKGKIKDGEVSRGKLEDNVVNTGKLEDDAVTTEKLANQAVKKIKIKDGDISKEKLDTEIKYWKLERGSQVFQGSGLVYTPFTDVDVALNVSYSGIVMPEGAVGVILAVLISDPVTTPFVIIKKNGDSGLNYQHFVRVQVPGIKMDTMVIIEMDRNSIIEWYFEGGSGAAIVQAKLWGWVIEPKA